jgi:hypothetical protein
VSIAKTLTDHDPKQPRSSWDTLVASTPVVMSVMATVMAGLSSSEMIRAQLTRSLAAQAQSRAADQWAFFQAKRTRGTAMEMTVDLLHALATPSRIDVQGLKDASGRLADEMQRLHKDALALKEALAKAGTNGTTRLHAAADRLGRVTEKPAKEAAALRDRLAETLAAGDVRRSFAYLASDDLPESPVLPIDPRIDSIVVQLEERRPDGELAPKIRALSLQDIQDALDVSDANRVAFERVGKPVANLLRSLDKLIEEQVLRVRPVQRAVREVSVALADLPARGEGPGDVQAAGHALLRTAAGVKSAAEDLNGDFKAAKHDYNARRYRREAEFNKEVAGLLDIEVRRYSLEADRLRERSKHFFYGMLGAQAAVTIASLSLAVRKRSLFWALAAAAGLGALLFGGYVYMFM